MTPDDIDAQLRAEMANASPEQLQQYANYTPPSAAENFANEAGNAAIVASQNLLQGVGGNVGGGIILTMRDIGDALGITSPEKTAEIRNTLRTMKEDTARSAEALGYPTLGKAAQVVGELAPMIAGGSIATSAGKSLLGAGRAADIAINTGVAAAQGFTSGLAEGGLSERFRNAETGGLFGGALSTVAGIASKALPAFKIDPDKAEALRAAGMKGAPVSTMMANDLPTGVRQWYEGIANSLNKVPFLGIKQRLRDWHFNKADEYTKTIFSEIDNSVPNVDIQKVNVLGRLNDSIAIPTDSINNMAQGVAQRLKSNPGLVLSPKASQAFEQVSNLPKMSFEQLWDLRKGLDTTMDSFKNDLTRSVNATELHYLGVIRKQVSSVMKDAADKAGVGRDWATMNEGYQHQIVGKELMDVFNASTKAGGQVVNRAAFNSNLHATLNHLKERGLEIPAYYKQAVKNATIISDELAKSSIKLASPGVSGNFQGFGTMFLSALGLGTATGLIPEPIFATISGITKGLGRLVTTQTGAKLLASLSQAGKPTMNNPNTRIAMMAAFNISHAEDNKPALENKATDDRLRQEMSSLTPEQLQQIANQGQQ